MKASSQSGMSKTPLVQPVKSPLVRLVMIFHALKTATFCFHTHRIMDTTQNQHEFHLLCPYAGCRRWFRSRNGLTYHKRVMHASSELMLDPIPESDQSIPILYSDNVDTDLPNSDPFSDANTDIPNNFNNPWAVDENNNRDNGGSDPPYVDQFPDAEPDRVYGDNWAVDEDNNWDQNGSDPSHVDLLDAEPDGLYGDAGEVDDLDKNASDSPHPDLPDVEPDRLADRLIDGNIWTLDENNDWDEDGLDSSHPTQPLLSNASSDTLSGDSLSKPWAEDLDSDDPSDDEPELRSRSGVYRQYREYHPYLTGEYLHILTSEADRVLF